MTERTLITIPATCIGEVELTPNVFLAFVRSGICGFAPCGFLGLGFCLSMSFGFTLRKHGSCIVRFPIPFIGFPIGGRCCRLGGSGEEVLPFQHLAQADLCLGKVGLCAPSHNGPIDDIQEAAIRRLGSS